MKKILATGLLGLALVSAIPAVAADSKADKTWQEAWTAYNIGQYKKTLRLLQPLATEGDARSQVLLGRCYENGLGVPQDLTTAFKWYMLAAEQNDAEAQTLVAYMLRSGAGVPRDTNGYLQWMQRAAQSGYAEAQFNMALIYADGELVTKDPEQSFDWAKRAAEQGNGQAQRFLGACYEVGFGVPENATESPPSGMPRLPSRGWNGTAASSRTSASIPNRKLLPPVASLRTTVRRSRSQMDKKQGLPPIPGETGPVS